MHYMYSTWRFANELKAAPQHTLCRNAAHADDSHIRQFQATELVDLLQWNQTGHVWGHVQECITFRARLRGYQQQVFRDRKIQNSKGFHPSAYLVHLVRFSHMLVPLLFLGLYGYTLGEETRHCGDL